MPIACSERSVHRSPTGHSQLLSDCREVFACAFAGLFSQLRSRIEMDAIHENQAANEGLVTHFQRSGVFW